MVLLYATATSAAPNYEINYQGKLTNASNVAVADDTYNMRFWLLTSPSIATTSAIWSEELTGTDKVQVTNGLFSIMLGSTSPLTGVDFNQTLYLGVEIGGTSTPTWDGEMSPRKILGAVPAAFHASTSQNAVTVGGVASTSFIRSDEADTASGLLTFTGGIISNSSSTITNLTTLIATTTTLVINGEQFTDLTGTGLTNSGGVLTASLGTDITAAEIANGDHGFFSYSSGVASLDTGGLTSANLASALTDETGTAGYAVFSGNPLLSGFRSSASSTIGDGTATGGLTISGGATTTGNAYFGGNVGIGSVNPTVKLHISGTTTSDIARLDIGLDLNPVVYPSAPTISLVATPGNVDAGVHYYYVTYYTDLGETELRAASPASVTTDAGNGQVSISLPTSSDYRVIGRRIYRSTANSANWANVKRVATVSDNSTTLYTDNISDASLTGTNYFFQDNSTSKYITVNSTQAAILSTQNTILGIGAGATIAAGTAQSNSNVLIGKNAGAALTTSAKNTAVGDNSLRYTTSGDSNTAVGQVSLYNITTGGTNVALGRNSGYYNQSGYNNVYIGGYSGMGVSGNSHNSNTFIGASSGYLITTGGNNTLLGYRSGYSLTSGSGNIILGSNADVPTATGSGQLNIGNVIYGTGLYSGSSTSSAPVYGNVGIGSTTPSRLLTVAGDIYALNNVTAASGTIAYASTTGLTATNANITNATSTTLAATASFKIGSDVITDITGTNLSVTNGVLSASASGGSNWLFDGTRLTPSSTSAIGIVTLASSTIGGGTGATGLTISGGATTTGNAYFGGSVGIGVTSPQYPFHVVNDSGVGSGEHFLGVLRRNETTYGGFVMGYQADGSDVSYGFLRGSGGYGTGIGITGNNSALYIAYPTGNVGIGTTSPSATLALTGSGGANLFSFASSTGSNLLSLGADGRLTFGTTTDTNIFINGGPTSTNPLLSSNQRNIGIGTQSLSYLGSDVTDNVAIGYQVLHGSSSVPMTGDHNTAIGNYALYSNTTGYQNTANGYAALLSNTTGWGNTANGLSALYSNTTGSSNTVNGSNALLYNQTGSQNTANGFYALKYNTTGYANTALGAYAGEGTSANSFSSSTFVGYKTALSLTTGNGNILLGYQAGDALTSGSRNILLGYDIDAPSNTGNYQLSIGNLIFGTNVDGTGTTVSTGNIGIGTSTPQSKLTVQGTGTLNPFTVASSSGSTYLTVLSTGMVGVGTTTPSRPFTVAGDGYFLNSITAASSTITYASSTALTVAGNTYLNAFTATNGTTTNATSTTLAATSFKIGSDVITDITGTNLSVTNGVLSASASGGSNWLFNGSRLTPSTTVGIGIFASSTIGGGTGATGLTISGGATTTGNAYFGGRLDISPTTATNRKINMGGTQTLYLPDQTDFLGTLILGDGGGSLNSLGANEGRYNTFLGLSAGTANTTGFRNVFVGHEAGEANITGYDNTFVGFQAGTLNDYGVQNSFFGYYSGGANTDGWNNAFFGYGAGGGNTTGDENVAIGPEAGFQNQTGDFNTLVGGHAGQGNASNSYSNVTALGYHAGFGITTGSNNILLGYNAGDALTSGSNNIALGYDIDLPSNTASNQLTIGNLIFGTNVDGTGTTVSTGNIGIGTSTPVARLSVTGAANTTNLFSFASSTGSNLLSLGADGRLTFGTTTGTNIFINGGPTSTNPLLSSNLRNIGIGTQSLSFLGTSLTDNVAIGYQALYGSSSVPMTGDANTAIGSYALKNNTTGYNNTANGYYALYYNTTGSNNTANGYGALTSNTTGWNNTANGYYALGSNTTGLNNTANGSYALYSNTTGSYNTADGYFALYSNTTGYENTANGYWSLFSNTTGYENTANGYWSLFSNTTGSQNTANGMYALRYNETGYANTALGYNAGEGTSANSFSSSTFVGYQTGLSLTTGNGNILLGYQAGDALTSGSNNIALGYDIDLPSNTASNQLTIGNLIFGTGIDGTGTSVSSGNIGIGTSTPVARLSVTGAANTTNLFSFASSTGSNLLSLGADGRLTFGTTTTTNIFINGGPTSTNPLLSSNQRNIGIGTQSLSFLGTSLTDNIAIGYQALYGSSSVPMTGGWNTAIGSYALKNNTTGYTNTANGYYSLLANTTGYANTANGAYALAANTTGSYNTANGSAALYSNTTGSYNTANGANALLYNTTGYSNTALGYNAGEGTIANSFSSSTFVGYKTALSLTTGSGNILLGYQAGDALTSGSRNIALGYDIDLPSNTSNYQLTIGNLIYGTNVDGTDTTVSTGNIGIGSTTPSRKFTVNGDMYGANILATGTITIGSTTPESQTLTIDKSGLTGSVVGGIKEYLQFTNSTLSALYYGDNTYIVNAPTATSTLVGSMLRIEDNSTLGNTVRGLEVQAYRGTNTKGENTALSGFARTFGVRGTTLGDAGDTYTPAGVFAETQGTTQGNALRAYSGTITSEELVSLFHDTSNFTGTGLQMNFGNAGGSFAATSSAKFIDLQVGGTSKFVVSANGSTTIGDGTVNASLMIPYGGICVDNDGSCISTTTGQIRSVTSALGNSDLAEMYFSGESLQTGEIVALAGGLSVERASEASAQSIIGVVSTKPGMTLGFDDSSLAPNEHPYPIGLKGRVPVRLSTENGPIAKGDRITISSITGVGMKATESSVVVGIALEDFDGTKAYSSGFLNQFGDDMVKERVAKKITIDPRTQDGCSFGGGSALGEESCDKERVKKTTKTLVTDDSEYQTMLSTLSSEPAEQITAGDGSETNVGQIIMFIDLGWYQIAEETNILAELASTTLLEDGSEEETLWSRVKVLASNFVDGVLTLAGLKTDELCVGNVCVDEATFLQMVESANATPIQSGVTGGGNDGSTVDGTGTTTDSGTTVDAGGVTGTTTDSGTPSEPTVPPDGAGDSGGTGGGEAPPPVEETPPTEAPPTETPPEEQPPVEEPAPETPIE